MQISLLFLGNPILSFTIFLGWVDHYRQQMENSTVTAATKEHHLFDMERKLELTLTENKMLKEANAKLKVQSWLASKSQHYFETGDETEETYILTVIAKTWKPKSLTNWCSFFHGSDHLSWSPICLSLSYFKALLSQSLAQFFLFAGFPFYRFLLCKVTHYCNVFRGQYLCVRCKWTHLSTCQESSLVCLGFISPIMSCPLMDLYKDSVAYELKKNSFPLIPHTLWQLNALKLTSHHWLPLDLISHNVK